MNKLTATLIICFGIAFPLLCRGQVIQSTSAVTLPTTYNGQSVSTIASGQSLTVTSNASITIGPGFIAQSGSTVLLQVSNNFSIPVPPANNNTNPELNWVQTTGYDENGNVVAQSKSFFDDNGQKLQDQVLSLSTGHVLASQSINDLYGRQAINTLAAPIYSHASRPSLFSTIGREGKQCRSVAGSVQAGTRARPAIRIILIAPNRLPERWGW